MREEEGGGVSVCDGGSAEEVCGRQDGAHPPSTLAAVLGHSPLVPMQIYCHSSAVLLQRGRT